MDQRNTGKSNAEMKYQMTVMTTRRTRKAKYTDAVFNNPLLMDIIIKYCIHESDGEELSSKDVLALRLINKTWLQSVSRVLIESCDSFINLSCESIFMFLKGSQLRLASNNFISVFSNKRRLEYSILPLKVEIEPYFFIKENYNMLDNLFQNCGEIISKICINYLHEGGSMILRFGQLNLPILKNLSFTFDGPPIKETSRNLRGYTLKFSKYENKIMGWEFLQELLYDTQNLKSFTLAQLDFGQNNKSKSNSLQLPESIKKLDIRCSLTNKEFELLSIHRLANLETLDLVIYETKQEEQLILKILTRFQHQLKNFSIKLFKCKNGVGSIQFPGVMSNLRSFSVSRHSFEFIPQRRQYFPNLVPNLTSASFTELTELEYLEWIRGPSFANVKTLETSLVTLAQNGVQRYHASANERVLSCIKTSFPNVQDLTLRFNFSEISNLKYLFENFETIKKLQLNFYGERDVMTGHIFASTLLGTSTEIIKKLMDNRYLKAAVGNSESESIMNLKELNSLSLSTPKDYDEDHPLPLDFFQVELCKKFGFDKMPQMKVLKLAGGFHDFEYVQKRCGTITILKNLNDKHKAISPGAKSRHYQIYYL